MPATRYDRAQKTWLHFWCGVLGGMCVGTAVLGMSPDSPWFAVLIGIVVTLVFNRTLHVDFDRIQEERAAFKG